MCVRVSRLCLATYRCPTRVVIVQADVKGLFVEKSPRFEQTVGRFLRSRSPSSLEAVAFELFDLMEMVEGKFIKYQVHQLWCVLLGERRKRGRDSLGRVV